MNDAAEARLERLIELLSRDATAPTTVRDPARVRRVHIADSLSGFEFPELRDAKRVADIGAGAGFPGLVIAAALPETAVDLIEASSRKCEFLERAVAAMEVSNANVIPDRAETWAGSEGREAYDVVTARAVGRLATLAELASPLLGDGGHMVAWKGRRDDGEEAELERAVPHTGVELVEVRWVGPYAGSRNRHLYLLRKMGATPPGLPRRPGMAKKRPLG